MTRLFVVTRDGKETALEGKPGISVMENIRDAGIDELLALCGGCCSCATCHVHVDSEFVDRLPPLGEEENDLLSGSSARRETSRLCCQLPFTEALDGLRLSIAPED